MQQLHGSGKTAVLVERIVEKVVNEGIDIDKLLVVTFTNAAAAEMRERILEELYKKIEENPNDRRLQKQIILLNKASISTIHSFCLDVIRNYFYEINVAPNARLADTPETEILREEALEELFDEKYENEDPEFLELVNIYCGYRDDEDLKKLVLDVFKFIQSTPFPASWMQDQIEKFNANDNNEDFGKTIWGEILIRNFKEEVVSGILAIKGMIRKLQKDQELEKYALILKGDIQIYENILNKCKTWDEIYHYLLSIEFERWPGDKKIISDLKDEAKVVRDKVRDKVKDRKRKTIYGRLRASESRHF